MHVLSLASRVEHTSCGLLHSTTFVREGGWTWFFLEVRICCFSEGWQQDSISLADLTPPGVPTARQQDSTPQASYQGCIHEVLLYMGGLSASFTPSLPQPRLKDGKVCKRKGKGILRFRRRRSALEDPCMSSLLVGMGWGSDVGR